jgi:integrase
MSIYRDPQGRRWVFEFDRYVGGARVRTRRRLPGAWTRAQAEAYDQRESARLYAVATGERQRYTIDQAVARYLTERAPSLKRGHGTAREIDLLSPYFEGRALESLPEVCAAYLADNRATLAPATIRNRLRYLTAACRWAWKHHGMGQEDPAARVVMPAVSNERQVYIDRRQMLKITRACRSWEVRAMIRIAFYSGMRLGEIVAAGACQGFCVRGIA